MTVQLAGFNFTVTDSVTGLPIHTALCTIHAGLNGTGDADGVYTDVFGTASIDAQWFVPRSWKVSKAGYISQFSNNMFSEIVVALVPTEFLLIVNIRAGAGGNTTPSGFMDVPINTQLLVTAYPDAGYILDYWLKNGQKSGNTNPTTFLIDQNGITIDAVFKVAEVPPPPPPPPWPVTRSIHLFDSVKLKAEWYDISKTMSRAISNIDTAMLVGGRLDYTVKYTQGLPIAEDANISIEGMNIVKEALSKGESKSGSVDLTGLIGREATFKISFPSSPGIWSEVTFDVWITLGFSGEPAIEPKTDDKIPDWQKWMIYGALCLGAFLILTRDSEKVIVIRD